jgi:hypothetical protein
VYDRRDRGGKRRALLCLNSPSFCPVRNEMCSIAILSESVSAPARRCSLATPSASERSRKTHTKTKTKTKPKAWRDPHAALASAQHSGAAGCDTRREEGGKGTIGEGGACGVNGCLLVRGPTHAVPLWFPAAVCQLRRCPLLLSCWASTSHRGNSKHHSGLSGATPPATAATASALSESVVGLPSLPSPLPPCRRTAPLQCSWRATSQKRNAV